MKISNSLRYIYTDKRKHYEQLREKVDKYFKNNIKDNWHYERRIKTEESFAQKIETGQYKKFDDIDDFFACTIVVENLLALEHAEKIIRKHFTVKDRRPNKKDFTPNSPDSFKFDDTRLYVKWKNKPKTKPTYLSQYLFEIQIKTFLAHAWSIATHDLTYKTDQKSWSKERVAFQIKAMLEHAEISIQEVNQLAKTSSLNKSDKYTIKISKTIDYIKNTWAKDSLPKDLKRLAENINKLIKALEINSNELDKIIKNEIKKMKNNKPPLNLSPYSFVVQALLNHETDKMKDYIMGDERNYKIYITKDIESPFTLDKKKCINALIEV